MREKKGRCRLLEKLEGTLEKIKYYNEESAYLVGVLMSGCGQRVPFVGQFPPLQEGEELSLKGAWQVHDRYGRQFAVDKWERLLPATKAGLKRYLASGLIKGIGPVTADAIVEHFGLDTLEVLEKEPERLREIAGIGKKKALQIVNGYRHYSDVQNVLVFLQGYGISVGQALRLYRRYGSDTVNVLRKNPYRMAEDIIGVGFKTADKIARQMGLAEDSPERVRAAVLYILGQAAEQGHVFLPRQDLCERVRQLIEFADPSAGETLLGEQLKGMARDGAIIIDESRATSVYQVPLYHSESGLARLIKNLASLSRPFPDLQRETALSRVAHDFGHLSGEQLAVLDQALIHGLLIVTGGPGTGKTTTIKALLALFRLLRQKVLLAAPTGRAAKRVTEATGAEASTIHRLLEYSYSEGQGFRFQRNENNPVEAGVVIIDEASMIDLSLMYSLAKALPSRCRLILVGDVDQLPSVGAGNVLRDLINGEVIPCFRLGYIFRQARESMITVNAHRVNQGQLPKINVRNKDFFFISQEDPQEVGRLIVELCRERLPNYGPFDPLLDLQVLTPMRKTVAGVDSLNGLLQDALNPQSRSKPEVLFRGHSFRLGDKVMQVRNNYQKEVFNGDMGLITAVDREEQELVVTFRDLLQPRPVVYDFSELDELVLSYAVSVHKSQGSEYPVVVMPVLTQHYMLLQRNLLYTAITRARKLAVLVGSRKALAIAVRNNRADERFSNLAGRIVEAFTGSPGVK